MAKDKKSFLMYSDSQGLVNKLPDDVAGRLLKYIYAYVNDENPQTDELLLEIAFEPIKMQLKRDLIKWDDELEKQKESGALGNLKRWNIDLYNSVIEGKITITEGTLIAKQRKESPPDTNSSPHDTNSSPPDKNETPPTLKIADSVTDNVSVTDINKQVVIGEKPKLPTNNFSKEVKFLNAKEKFKSEVRLFADRYDKNTLNNFFEYWTEPNKTKTKMLWEMQKTFDVGMRLNRWSKNDFGNTKKSKEESFDKLLELTNSIRNQ